MLPGGHLESGESFEDCGRREIEEETSIILDDIRFWTVGNVIYRLEDQHWVVIYMVADLPDGQEAKVTEPEECKTWGWFLWDELPWPLMLSTGNLIVRGLNPFKVGRGLTARPMTEAIHGRYVGPEARFWHRTADIVVDGLFVRAQFDGGALWETNSRLTFRLDEWEVDINGNWQPLVVQ
jgi:8-oxo-dGTP diphosphatase